MNGTVVTTRRTAAASAVAADVLARPDATELAVIGCGVQGREHVRMISRVRPLGGVRLWAPTERNRNTAASELAAGTGLGVRACDTARAAVTGAHVVSLCTLSSDPVVEASWLAPGTTVVSVGSFTPDRCEVGPDVTAAARVVVDHPATAARHAGPIMQAVRSGRSAAEEITGLGDRRAVSRAGLPRPARLLQHSTGIGIQDAAAATTVLDAAPVPA